MKKVTVLVTEINGNEVVIYVDRTRNDIYTHRLVTTLNEPLMSKKPLGPTNKCSGKILVSHCDCMAGLGEACSHVAPPSPLGMQ